MRENMDDDLYPYIDDDCLIEDEFYNDIKEMIECKLCQKLLKTPMMCNVCGSAFCNNCVKKMQKKKDKSHKCKKAKYIENKNVIKMMNKLKYLCRNCKNEVKKEDIENHLKRGCEKLENPTRLMDSIYKKKLLTKLNKDEINKLSENKEKVNHLSGKI